jgi:hypothetical protein
MFFNKTLFIFIFKELKRIKTTFEKMSKVFNLNNISDLFILVQNLTKSSECNIDESFDCVQEYINHFYMPKQKKELFNNYLTMHVDLLSCFAKEDPLVWILEQELLHQDLQTFEQFQELYFKIVHNSSFSEESFDAQFQERIISFPSFKSWVMFVTFRAMWIRLEGAPTFQEIYLESLVSKKTNHTQIQNPKFKLESMNCHMLYPHITHLQHGNNINDRNNNSSVRVLFFDDLSKTFFEQANAFNEASNGERYSLLSQTTKIISAMRINWN